MSQWIYIFGEVEGEDIKIGSTGKQRIEERLKSVNGTQTTSCEYRILAGVVGSSKDEDFLKRYFEQWRRTDKGSHTEYFEPSSEIVEYANWLRSQWWVSPDSSLTLEEMPIEDSSHWLPEEGRRIARPPIDPERIVQEYDDLEGPLANTAWSWMVSPRAQIQDYFTPAEIVEAAREAMGGIDLDAASHWLANRELKIPDYFHTGRSAHANRWYGKVWLNPPYGNNAPWFEDIVSYVESGDIEQLCMLSPMWSFQTTQARPVMELATSTVLLSPTPTFWGNREGKTGTNLPHGIVYIGDRHDDFRRAFAPFGITVRIDLEQMAVG